MKKIFLILVLVFASLTTFSQSADQEQFINDLRNLHSLLLSKDFTKAKEYFISPLFIADEEFNEMLGKLIELDEISDNGINILSQNGIFGSLHEVFPEKANRWLSKEFDFYYQNEGEPIQKEISSYDTADFQLYPVYFKAGLMPSTITKYCLDDPMLFSINMDNETTDPLEAEVDENGSPISVFYYLLADCYAMNYNQAEVAAQWDGEHFRFFRLDDVGKIE